MMFKFEMLYVMKEETLLNMNRIPGCKSFRFQQNGPSRIFFNSQVSIFCNFES